MADPNYYQPLNPNQYQQPNQQAYQNNNYQNNGGAYPYQPNQNNYNNNAPEQFFDQQPDPNRRQSQRLSVYENQIRSQNLKKLIDNIVGELVYNAILVIAIIIFVITNSSMSCGGVPVKMWVAVVAGNYIADSVILMFQFNHLKRNGRENIWIMALRYLFSCFLVGWLIYGNIMYYNDLNNINRQQCGSLNLCMFLILLLGYFEMLKCCCIGTCVCLMIPLLIYAGRRAQRPAWIPAPPNFIQNLVKKKFNSTSNAQAQQVCAICLVDFTENDEIIPLPCDEKHIFHPECITSWLDNNNSCPLCKKEITKEALDLQRNQT